VQMSKQEAENKFSAWDVPDTSRRAKELDRSGIPDHDIANWKEGVSEVEKQVEEVDQDDIPMLTELSRQVRDSSGQLRSVFGNNSPQNLYHGQYVELQITESRLLHAEARLDAALSSTILSRSANLFQKTTSIRQRIQEIIDNYEPGTMLRVI
jgi:hypothetical protein